MNEISDAIQKNVFACYQKLTIALIHNLLPSSGCSGRLHVLYFPVRCSTGTNLHCTACVYEPNLQRSTHFPPCRITVITRIGSCFHVRAVENNNPVAALFPDTVTDPNLAARPHDRQTALLIMKRAWSDWRKRHLCTATEKEAGIMLRLMRRDRWSGWTWPSA